MKRKIILAGMLLVLISANAQVSGIDRVLRSIEENNKELRANEHLTVSKKLEAKTDNNLSDPSISYSYQFGHPQELGKTGELTVTQGFDFPTVYGSRNRLNKLKATSFDYQFDAFRQQLLLTAKEACIDLIQLNKQKALIDERLKNAQTLSEVYARRLATGDANALETNKINLELMNVKTEATMNEAARRSKLQELIAMNGNVPLELNDTEYSPVEELTSFEQLKQDVLPSDVTLRSLESESAVAKKQISVNKSGWLPKLELGYRRNTGEGEQFNGFIVGVSVPLFENKNKVKAAKAQALYAELQKAGSEEKVESVLYGLYKEAETLSAAMKDYNKALEGNDMKLLRQALDARQISLIEYFTEVSVIYQSHQNFMELESRYQKVMAQIYKNRL